MKRPKISDAALLSNLTLSLASTSSGSRELLMSFSVCTLTLVAPVVFCGVWLTLLYLIDAAISSFGTSSTGVTLFCSLNWKPISSPSCCSWILSSFTRTRKASSCFFDTAVCSFTEAVSWMISFSRCKFSSFIILICYSCSSLFFFRAFISFKRVSCSFLFSSSFFKFCTSDPNKLEFKLPSF